MAARAAYAGSHAVVRATPAGVACPDGVRPGRHAFGPEDGGAASRFPRGFRCFRPRSDARPTDDLTRRAFRPFRSVDRRGPVLARPCLPQKSSGREKHPPRDLCPRPASGEFSTILWRLEQAGSAPGAILDFIVLTISKINRMLTIYLPALPAVSWLGRERSVVLRFCHRFSRASGHNHPMQLIT